MPVQSCFRTGKPGFKWGKTGTCYTYKAGDVASRVRARRQAEKQGRAIKRREARGR